MGQKTKSDPPHQYYFVEEGSSREDQDSILQQIGEKDQGKTVKNSPHKQMGGSYEDLGKEGIKREQLGVDRVPEKDR